MLHARWEKVSVEWRRNDKGPDCSTVNERHSFGWMITRKIGREGVTLSLFSVSVKRQKKWLKSIKKTNQKDERGSRVR